jgi:hypothetical protein
VGVKEGVGVLVNVGALVWVGGAMVEVGKGNIAVAEIVRGVVGISDAMALATFVNEDF